MIKIFNEDYFLDSNLAKKLYNKYAKDEPIFDYHCHIQQKDLWEDRKFKTITELWLESDHYKWRLMRINGYKLDFIKNKEVDDFDKFLAFVKTMEIAIGNPVFQWAHLELQKYFGITDVLNERNARKIYDEANRKLKNLSARKLIKLANVYSICTTDDPIDNLEYHKNIKKDNTFETKVLPGFRPDKIYAINKLNEWNKYIKKLEPISNVEIKDFESLIEAIAKRVDYFDKNGCVSSDISQEPPVFIWSSIDEVNKIVSKALSGTFITNEEIIKFQTRLLVSISKKYYEKNWVMQIHLGAIRNTSKKALKKYGVDIGYDNPATYSNVLTPLARLMSKMEENGHLPKIIIYNLNPSNDLAICALANTFNDGTSVARVQHGPAWWFNDNLLGNEKIINILANQGLLANSVGMLTDSRSITSYVRHDFFRRIICNYIANEVEKGLFSEDEKLLSKIIKDISFTNAKKYFLKNENKGGE